MKLSKIQAFLLFIWSWIMLCCLYQAVWLFHGITNGQIVEFGKGSGKGYRSIENVRIRYYVEGREYQEMFLRGGLKSEDEVVKIKYLSFAPGISRIDSFAGNWAMIFVLTLIVLISISIIFLTRDLIPRQATIIISASHPFFTINRQR